MKSDESVADRGLRFRVASVEQVGSFDLKVTVGWFCNARNTYV